MLSTRASKSNSMLGTFSDICPERCNTGVMILRLQKITLYQVESVDGHDGDDEVRRRPEHGRQRRQDVDVDEDGVAVVDAVVRLEVFS